MKRTSEQWEYLFTALTGKKIYDPDGWRNFDTNIYRYGSRYYFNNMRITWMEFQRRAAISTIGPTKMNNYADAKCLLIFT